MSFTEQNTGAIANQPALTFDKVAITSFKRLQSMEPPYVTFIEAKVIRYGEDSGGTRYFVGKEETITVKDFDKELASAAGGLDPAISAQLPTLLQSFNDGMGLVVNVFSGGAYNMSFSQ